MARKSVTTDELQYIAAGYYHLRTGDFNFNATNPPLMKMIAAVPLLYLAPELPEVRSDPRAWSLPEQWKYARRFLYHNQVDADRMLLAARLPIVAVSLLLGIFVFRWGAALFGALGGCTALFFYALSPNILAHARLATHDLGLTAWMFIACYYFWRFMDRPSVVSLLLCGLFAGLALLTKTTAVFLAPIFGLYVLICMLRAEGKGIFERFPWVRRLDPKLRARRQLLSAGWACCAIAFIVLLVLNAGYGFQGTLRAPPDAQVAARETTPHPSIAETGVARSALQYVVPAPFLGLVQFQSRLVAKSGSVYFAGKLYESGLWYLMIVSFIIKTPIPVILLLGAAVFHLSKNVRRLRGEWLLASFVCVILFVFSYLSNVNVGLRYILPIYPFVHVLISAWPAKALGRSRAFGIVAVLLGGWYVASTAAIHPHYLAYFNETIGGPRNGYRYLVDSNLDWGQDLEGLRDYVAESKLDRIALGYFGSGDAAYYGLNYEYLPSVGLAPKEPGQKWWYEDGADSQPIFMPKSPLLAVSATLMGRPGWIRGECYEVYERLRRCEPVDQVGYSILLFDSECIRPQ